jgi:hypothetical protein
MLSSFLFSLSLAVTEISRLKLTATALFLADYSRFGAAIRRYPAAVAAALFDTIYCGETVN